MQPPRFRTTAAIVSLVLGVAACSGSAASPGNGAGAAATGAPAASTTLQASAPPAAISTAAPSAAASAAPSANLGTAVTLYTADGLEGWYSQIIPTFESKYGVHVSIVTAGSGAITARLALEAANPQADVFVSMQPFVTQAVAKNLLDPTQVSGENQVPAQFKDPNGYWTTLVNNYINWIYNPDLVTPAPATWQDLLNSRFANMIAYSNPSLAGDGFAVIIDLMHDMGSENAAFSYLKQLQANVKMNTPGTGSLDPLVGKGEIWVANGDLQMDLADQASGMNIKVWFPKDSQGQATTFSDPYIGALVRNAPHPAAAKALLAYLLSPDAQAAAVQIYGLPARSDVHPSSAKYQAMEQLLNGVQVFTPDWSSIVSSEPALLNTWKSQVQGQ